MAEQITIIVSPDGSQVTLDAEGFMGTKCEETIDMILAEISAGPREKRKKAEYFSYGGSGVSVNT